MNTPLKKCPSTTRIARAIGAPHRCCARSAHAAEIGCGDLQSIEASLAVRHRNDHGNSIASLNCWSAKDPIRRIVQGQGWLK
ncbi:MAG: hypothetical protein WAN01_07560, partial [Bradyrhizobium sp.]